MNLPALLVLLIGGHALADYPLQGDFLAKAKNVSAPIPGVPWWQAMAAHAAIHAFIVLTLIGAVGFALFEFVAHFVIDYAKCRGWIGFNTDQALHIGCKVGYAVVACIMVVAS